MISDYRAINVVMAAKFQRLIKPRDIFLHDGAQLRRIRVTVGHQLLALAVMVASIASCSAAIGHLLARVHVSSSAAIAQAAPAPVSTAPVSMAMIRQEARAHAARLERRQAFLAAVLSGKADADGLEALLPTASQPISEATAAIVAPLDRIEGQQVAMIDDVLDVTENRYKSARSALNKLGLSPSRFMRGGRGSSTGMGGPFEPLPADDAAGAKTEPKADPMFKSLFLSWKKLDALQQGVIAVPSSQPVPSDLKFTSGFGVRSDPFRGTAAMHAGIDLAGPMGTPIYATADGVVGRAGWANGYGKLVEIEHGKGLQTRFGHLSEILVAANTRVKRGQLIGRMGSTGRSTGSHLHYEVRIDGRAVNPIPFMQTNGYLLAMQRRETVGEVALGGPGQ